MATARFRFHGALASFLARDRRDRAFEYSCARAASLKNAIEALGVPHTEVGPVTVNGQPATLQRTVREGDSVEVLPLETDDAQPLLFLADAHLGGLARFLRMLGFDTLHDPALADGEICRIAGEERRVVLTRDRELLKRREVARGCYVHALKAEAQLREVAERYRLEKHARPFTLCLHCNLALAAIDKRAVADRLPPGVLASQERFTHCAACDRVYWPGSHYERMKATLADCGFRRPFESPASRPA
ncbi:MAG: Mut7-C RNAse domain-containing protein [Betaproteobacteria bacterium]